MVGVNPELIKKFLKARARFCHSPEVVPATQDEICLCVESRTNLAEPTVAAATFKTILVPEHVQRLQQEPEGYEK